MTYPDHVEYGTGIDYMDYEGRVIRADFGELSVMSLYLPSGTNTARLDFKFKFMEDFQYYIDELKKSRPILKPFMRKVLLNLIFLNSQIFPK